MTTDSSKHEVHDIVLSGGRVLDPETGFDSTAFVGLSGGSISAVSTTPLLGRRILDVAGMVVAPGWIDLHSHSHTVVGHRLQACDGVTTVLELEAGVSPTADAYNHALKDGRPLNFGFSASWGQSRMTVIGETDAGGGFGSLLEHLGTPGWQVEGSPRQVNAVMESLRNDLADGALGIGIIVGYAPRIDPAEYLSVAGLAASTGVPTFTHARDLIDHAPDGVIDGAEEIVRAAGATGAHMHYCHINSTSLRQIDRVHDLVTKVTSEGSRVTTEAYPYGSGMTGIGAAFLQPERLADRGIRPQSITYARTREVVSDEKRLRELQEIDPGGLAIIRYLDEENPSDAAHLDRALLFPDTVVGSDAVPLTWSDGSQDPMAWPPSEDAFTHPRTAGTFSKMLRKYVRELGSLSLMEAVRRASLLPTQVLEGSVPSMRLKGRLQVGCDADIVVFDPATVSDLATYEDSTRPSIGYEYVFVNGQPLIFAGELDVTAMPGRPVRR